MRGLCDYIYSYQCALSVELLPAAGEMKPLLNEPQEPEDSRKIRLGVSTQDLLTLMADLIGCLNEVTCREVSAAT